MRISNVKVRSENTVILTGIGAPGSMSLVLALNCLQNSMMARPRWPRAGPIGGEGACLCLLEPAEQARERGVSPLAVVRSACGLGGSSDVAALLRELLGTGGVGCDEVDVVVASADGISEGGRLETEAIIDVFGGTLRSPAVVSPKGILGETWAASGPFGVAVVVAEERYQAAVAVDAVVVDYESLPAVVDLEDALADTTVIHDELGTNKSYTWELCPDRDAVDAAFAAAAHTVSERYVQQRLIPAAMEPRGVAVIPSPHNGDVTV